MSVIADKLIADVETKNIHQIFGRQIFRLASTFAAVDDTRGLLFCQKKMQHAATSGKKEKMRNETADLACGLRFHRRSTVKAPEVNVYRGQPPIFSTNMFCNNF